MEYNIRTISSKDGIDVCPVFHVDQYNWGGDYRPETYGSLAFIPGTGFYVKMTCREKDPIRTYINDNDPVYLDSAMEAFFQFYPVERPVCYLNFEVNANGVLLAKYGDGRYTRTTFPKELHEACQCRADVLKDGWTMEIVIPLPLIHFVYGKSDFKKGDIITCNFYKLKESDGLTHFGSYTKIDLEEPNFHLPEFFAKGRIE